MSMPRAILRAIIDLKRAFETNGMSAPFAMTCPDRTYEKLMDGMADSHGVSRAALDQQVAHGSGAMRLCGVEIPKL